MTQTIDNVKSQRLKTAYSSKTVEDQKALYRDWAPDYENHTVDKLGWIGYVPAAREFAKRVTDKSSRILDVGCGTGLSGMALSEQGFTNIDGVDLSPEMLALAKDREIYNSLGTADLTKPIEVDAPYDAVFSSGVFGFGPPYPEHIKNTLDVLKPGGIAVHTVNGAGWQDANWEEKLANVIKSQSLELIEKSEIAYLEKEGINGVLLVFRAN